MVTYGSSADVQDKSLCFAEYTVLQCLNLFAKAVVAAFSTQLFSAINKEETALLLQRAEKLGLPVVLGSIDCCKCRWTNSPTAHHGQYRGKVRNPTITMKALSGNRLFFWHTILEVPGCNKDVTFFNASTIPRKMSDGTYPCSTECTVNGERRNKPHQLCDAIYPKSLLFLHSIANPSDENVTYFVLSKKDAERT